MMVLSIASISYPSALIFGRDPVLAVLLTGFAVKCDIIEYVYMRLYGIKIEMTRNERISSETNCRTGILLN